MLQIRSGSGRGGSRHRRPLPLLARRRRLARAGSSAFLSIRICICVCIRRAAETSVVCTARLGGGAVARAEKLLPPSAGCVQR